MREENAGRWREIREEDGVRGEGVRCRIAASCYMGHLRPCEANPRKAGSEGGNREAGWKHRGREGDEGGNREADSDSDCLLSTKSGSYTSYRQNTKLITSIIL